MADIEGNSFPVPPKRPTVIRPGTNGPTVPARPAPPLPVGRPPPPVPNRLNDSAPLRTPASVTLPATPQAASQPTKQQERPIVTDSGSVRKRPEITIVCARPMSEVGFRTEKSAVSQTTLKTEKTPEVPGKPPPPDRRNVSPVHTERVPSSRDQENLLVDFESECIPPPHTSNPKPSGTRPPPPKPTSVRGAPPVPKKVETEVASSREDLDILKAPPSPAKRPGPPPTPPKVSNTFSSESTIQPGSKPLRAQHAEVPSKLCDTHTFSAVLPAVTDTGDFKRVHSEPNTEMKDINPETDDAHNQINTPSLIANTVDEYAVINKPKRPTIIRPSKPSIKESSLDSDDQKAVRNPPVPSPRMPRKEREANSSDSEFSSQKTAVGKDELGIANTTPEFLKLKLKSTTNQSSDTNDTNSGTKRETVSIGKGPPPVLTPKPKPGILAKPQVSTKPKFNTSSETDQTGEIRNAMLTDNADKSIDKTSVKVNEQKRNEERDVDIGSLKQAAVQRPTIIRPAKSLSTEKLNSSDSQKGADTTQGSFVSDRTNISQSVDDSDLSAKPILQPPLPNKRPVSMINIPKSVEQDTNEVPSSKSMNFAAGDIGGKPQPVPRPVARARPMSVAVPVSKQTSGIEERSAGPPRPQHRPVEHDTGKKVSLGVAVLPRPIRSETSGDIVTPPKQERRPPPPKVSPRTEETGTSEKYNKISPQGPPKPGRPSAGPTPTKISPKMKESSSSDEDVKTSLQGPPKPSRPSVRPPPPKVSPKSEVKDDSSSDEEYLSVSQEPPRPPPPSVKKSPGVEKPQRPNIAPARKCSMQEVEKDENSVQLRPPKPESRPSKPMSTPGKLITPPGSKPSRPTSMAVKKTGAPELPRRPGPGHPLYHHMMKAAHGVAEHDFTGSQHDELSFKAGDVIILVKSIDAEWIVGNIGEKEGMFPRSYIKVKIPLTGERADEDSDSSDSEEMFYDATSEKPDLIGVGPRCRARFDFDGEGPEDLVFEDGDVIKLLERVGPEWRKGELNGKVGLFPLSFVEIIEDLPADEAPDETSLVVYAMFDYEGQDDELSFQRGDTIKVQYKINDEWLYGECGGKKGQFPVPFVDHMPANLPPFPTQKEVSGTDPVAESEASLQTEDTKRKVKGPPSPTVAQKVPSPKTTKDQVPYCIALYDFPGETEEDLSFVAGDRIELLERIGTDWLKGCVHGTTGMFPAAFVEILEDLTDSSTVTHREHYEEAVYGIAQYDFKGETENELTFEAGTQLKLLEKVEGAEDWQWGELDGHRGMFPAAFVQAEK